MQVKFKDKTGFISKNIKQGLTDSVLDLTLDLKRTAAAAAPHKSGFLDTSGVSHSVKNSRGGMTGTVSFRAMDGRFDYSEWTHNADYTLGDKSKLKPGGKSIYGTQNVPVGKGYLSNSLEYNSEGYLNKLSEDFRSAIEKGG